MSEDRDKGEKDLYEVLGCSPSSSLEQLKQAYHRKLLESHPDKSNNRETSREFQEIKSAWQILGNPKLREEYDVKCRQADLEAAGAVVYARLRPSELEETEDEDILSYQCRCGNDYLVQKADLQESNCVVHVPCQDCTFVIAIET